METLMTKHGRPNKQQAAKNSAGEKAAMAALAARKAAAEQAARDAIARNRRKS